MARESKIGWTDSSQNFWIGCEEVGPGCDFCYAKRDNERRKWVDGWGPNGERRRTKTWGPRGKPLRGAPKNWMREGPAFYAEHGRNRRAFCNSLADFFDKKAPAGAREDAWEVLRATPMIEWQVVTKRISNVEKMLPPDWSEAYGHIILILTVCNQEEANRDVPRLLALKKKYPWLRVGLSVEPMLGHMTLCRLEVSAGITLDAMTGFFTAHGEWKHDLPEDAAIDHLIESCPEPPKPTGALDWVICGGESGIKGQAREFRLVWARWLLHQCVEGGVPFFMKQLGNNPIFADNDNRELLTGSGKWDAPEAWPEDLRIQQFPPQRIAA